MITELDIVNPLDGIQHPYVGQFTRLLWMQPTQAVRLLPALREIQSLHSLAMHNNQVRQALEVLESCSDPVIESLWLSANERGIVAIQYDFTRFRQLRDALLRGSYDEAKGLLLYALMWSHCLDLHKKVSNNWSDDLIDTWDSTCADWGFPNMSEETFYVVGPLPSLSAVFVDECYGETAEINNTIGWRAEWEWQAGEDEEEDDYMVALENWQPRGEIDLETEYFLHCVDMSTESGRRTAWEILKIRVNYGY